MYASSCTRDANERERGEMVMVEEATEEKREGEPE
jgi:hypothetical protein